jgi:Fe-S oxidoreductase
MRNILRDFRPYTLKSFWKIKMDIMMGVLCGAGGAYLTKDYPIISNNIGDENYMLACSVLGGVSALVYNIIKGTKKTEKQSQLENNVRNPTQ